MITTITGRLAYWVTRHRQPASIRPPASIQQNPANPAANPSFNFVQEFEAAPS